VTTSAQAAPSGDAPRWRREIALPRWLVPRDLAALGALAVVVGVLCWPVIARAHVYYERDVHLYLYPHAEAFVRVLAQGSLPLWNPYVAFGEPLLANPQMQVFYPPTWMHLVMEPWTWYAAFVVTHLLFTSAGAYYLARRLRASRLAAFLAGAGWVASGPLLSLVNNAHHLTGAAWMPWVVAGTDAALASPSARRVCAAAAAVALQVVAGSADMCVLAALLAVANALRHGERDRLIGLRNQALIRTGISVVALGLGLSAAQWVATLEVAGRSSRFDQPERIRTYWSTHPGNLVQAVLPVPLHELPLSASARAALYESREPFLLSLYVGLAAAVLVLLGAFETRAGRPIAVLLVVIVLIALGRHTPVFAAASTAIAPLRLLRYPVKALVAAALLWSLLAGLGLDALRSAARRHLRVAVLSVAAGVVALATAVAVLAGVQPDLWAPAFLQRSALDPPFAHAVVPVARRVAVAAGLGALALMAAALCGVTQRRRWLVRVAALAVVVDLLFANRDLNRTCAPELMAWRPPAVDAVRASDGRRAYSYDYFVSTRGRASLPHPPYALAAAPPDPVVGAVALRGALYPSVLAQWGVESSYDLDQQGLFPTEMAILSRFLRIVEETPAHLKLLRMGAVSRLAALHTVGLEDLTPVATIPTLLRAPLRVYEVPDPVPRAYAVGGVRRADGDEALAVLQDSGFDPAREVILADAETVSAPPSPPGRCRVIRWSPDRMTLEADMDRPGHVVLVDTYDPGWRTSVDGQPVPLLRANVAFRAVAVPAGRHVIDSTYRPPAVGLGLALSVTTAAIAAAVAWRRRGR
jgi:hypothetical protein